jgi:hypothetical protein
LLPGNINKHLPGGKNKTMTYEKKYHEFVAIRDCNTFGYTHASKMLVEKVNNMGQKNIRRRVSSFCKNVNSSMIIEFDSAVRISNFNHGRFMIEMINRHYYGLIMQHKDEELRRLLRVWLNERYNYFNKGLIRHEKFIPITDR